MDATSNFTLASTLFSLLFALFFAWISFWIIKRKHLLQLPPQIFAPPISILQLIGAFLIYLFAAAFVPSLVQLIAHLPKKDSWSTILSLYVIFLLLVIYCFSVKKETRHFLFWGFGVASLKRFVYSFKVGLFALLLSYPWVLLMSLVTSVMMHYFWKSDQVKQVAVEELKQAGQRPLMFFALAICIVFLVPFIEELLFRGFLQSFFRKYLNRFWSIFLSSFIFSSLHYSKSQGLGNFQLILSLFILSLFIGFIYEKERSLWAPYSMHLFFNAITVIFLSLDRACQPCFW